MNSIMALIGIVIVVLVDYYWFDTEQKRWGWMKNWSTLQKRLFLYSIIAITAFIYIGTEYF